MENIRLANLKDMGSVSKIHCLTWKGAYKDIISKDFLDEIREDRWINTMSKLLSEKNHEIAVYKDDKIDVGCISFGKGRDSKFDGYGEIISFYVLPEFSGRKIGYYLMNFAVDRLKRQGYKQCYLWVLKENKPAIDFYERYGFVNSNIEITDNIGNDILTEVAYIINLE